MYMRRTRIGQASFGVACRKWRRLFGSTDEIGDLTPSSSGERGTFDIGVVAILKASIRASRPHLIKGRIEWAGTNVTRRLPAASLHRAHLLCEQLPARHARAD